MPKTSACGLRRKDPHVHPATFRTSALPISVIRQPRIRVSGNSLTVSHCCSCIVVFLFGPAFGTRLMQLKPVETTERRNFSDLTTMHSESFHQHPLSPSEDRMLRSRWKRAVDLAGCIAALPLLGAVTLFAALVIGFTAPGPLFFRQPAIGNNGRRFSLYRIRTMHVRCSRTKHGSEKPPYFVGGRWLHTSGLANLPQIINVWRGETSMIGPRPKAGLAGEVVPTA